MYGVGWERADCLWNSHSLILGGERRGKDCAALTPRVESQTEEGEALRMDDDFSYVAAWQYNGEEEPPTCHKEDLSFQYVLPSQRSYK